MKYVVIRRADLIEFEETISRMLRDGWTPVGGVSIMDGALGYDKFYIQAMMTERWEPQK